MALRIKHALFDFDGTISLIREGWQPIMTDMMVRILLATPHHEDVEELRLSTRAFIDELTGKQTMYQMLRLVEEVERRGGKPRDPLDYKGEYLSLLEDHIKHRIEALQDGDDPLKYTVVGARSFLERLRAEGVSLSLASGTDEGFVHREARLLGVEHLFEHIGGARANYKEFSKRIAIERIIREANIDGPELAVFGDGFVEIEEGKKIGALAVGVASNEAEGGIDEWKKERLLRAGADIIISDFSDVGPLWTALAA